MSNDKFKALYEHGIVKFLPEDEAVTLQSGKRSRFYVSGRGEVTMDVRLSLLLGKCVKEVTVKVVPDIHNRCTFIGIPTVGTGIVTAAMMSVVDSGRDFDKFSFLIMREQKKKHGKDQKWLNGTPDPDSTIVLVDNVLTTGKSLIDTAQKLSEDRIDVSGIHVILLVDRGGKNMRQQVMAEVGFASIHTLFTLREIVRYFVFEKWWPEEAWKVFLEEEF